jgi:hypothetical protein
MIATLPTTATELQKLLSNYWAADATTVPGPLTAEVRPPKGLPPTGAQLYFVDQGLQPCPADKSALWTWEGAETWFHGKRWFRGRGKTWFAPARPGTVGCF